MLFSIFYTVSCYICDDTIMQLKKTPTTWQLLTACMCFFILTDGPILHVLITFFNQMH